MPLAGKGARFLSYWPLWVFVLSVFAATAVALKYYRDGGGQPVADYSSIAGTGISIAGFVLTIGAVLGTRTAHEARQEGSAIEIHRRARDSAMVSWFQATSAMATLRQDFEKPEGWRDVAVHLQLLVDSVLSLDEQWTSLGRASDATRLEPVIRELQPLLWSYRNAVRKGRQPVGVAGKVQKLLSELELQLTQHGVRLDQGAES